ncbi:sushi, von Willebrand factor type A, EGF and pentraxin domain-containing protein 1-like [Ptychodera flava]|uniref:sushi, von Willebrand factor type A, EGF and pentraxin domain-containing protein 1-like n=1 Tax=Ptychodera flava TaxID=63121 RepID=UPI00396AA2DF
MKILGFIASILLVGTCVSALPSGDCSSGELKGKMAEFAGDQDSYMMLTDVKVPDLAKVSSCWWVLSFTTEGSTADITYFTYTTGDEYKGSIFAKDVRSFKVYFNRLRAYGGSDFDIRYGVWHHLCIDWASASGDYHFYLDGKMMKAGSGFKQGEVIQGGGVIYVGQYLAKATGEFWDPRYSYKGYMAGFNMWDDIITQEEVKALAAGRCSTKSCGNLLAWTDFGEDDMIGVETCDTPLKCEPRVTKCEGGELAGKVLQMDNSVGPHGYVQSFQDVPDLKALTVCAWGKTMDTSSTIDLFSYRLKDAKVGSFSVSNPTNLQLFVNAEAGSPSGAAINDGKWYHVCATWSSDVGAHQYFGNGHLAASGSGLMAGQTIQGGGAVLLGVKQRKMGVDLDWKNRFNHEITEFNVWGSVLSDDQISKLCAPMNGQCGDVISWHYFKLTDLSRDVAVKDSDVPYM